MKKNWFFLVILLNYFQGLSQDINIDCIAIKQAGDCYSAIEINPINKLLFNCSPKGCGSQLEIKNNSSKSIFFFEKEHNTIWLKFNCPYNALMCFDIVPNDTTYDFDFLLFKNEENNFCKNLIYKQTKPIRTNISRNNLKNKSITGLNINAKKQFIPSGIQPMYSKALKVNKSENYFLVIDNVYGGESGFSIQFNYYKEKTIKGSIIDKNTNNPIYSNIKIENANNGKQIAESQSDSITGEFNLDYKATINEDYFLITESKNYFFTETLISSISKYNTVSSDLEIKVSKLKKNENLKLHNLNFYGDSYEYLPTAIPSLNRLLSLMQNNSTLKILIEGHTNGCPGGIEYSQMLSENRAKTIKDFLIKNGINKQRLVSKGFNCSKMLYPHMETNSEREKMMNRRVEILVLDF
jgi:outer membrane protein OmpA-like peptidoglycan-associated protein